MRAINKIAPFPTYPVRRLVGESIQFLVYASVEFFFQISTDKRIHRFSAQLVPIGDVRVGERVEHLPSQRGDERVHKSRRISHRSGGQTSGSIITPHGG